MAFRRFRRTFTQHREVILAATFVAMATYELLELVWLSASLPLHAIQVMIILAATWVVLRAWRERAPAKSSLPGSWRR